MVGRTVGFGRYQLLGLLGRGGMGSVYQAEDRNLANRKVAVKEMIEMFADETARAKAIEDFRRDGQSVKELRRARFGNGWVKNMEGTWLPLKKARFTASNAEWESKENIDAGAEDSWFFLATGGDVKMTQRLARTIALPTSSSSAPPARLLTFPPAADAEK